MRRVFCLVSALLWLSQVPALAQQKCDPNLRVRAGDPLGYRVRGDRCEGVFVEDVSFTLLLGSFHYPRKDFQPRVGTSVRLTWSLPPANQVQVQAVSLRPQLFFRMDTVRPATETTYLWPTDFVERVKLTGAEIGLLSWADLPIGGRTQRVYSPVSIADRVGEPEVLLVPEAQLNEMTFSLVTIDGQGRPDVTVVSDRRLSLGYYPAGQPIAIRLPVLDAKRIYRIEVAASLKNGGSVTRDVYVVNYQN
jgi:hypothetical protein